MEAVVVPILCVGELSLILGDGAGAVTLFPHHNPSRIGNNVCAGRMSMLGAITPLYGGTNGVGAAQGWMG